MQYFLLPTNLVIVFVHLVSTGVLYEPRQYSLFWDYIPESKLCFCLNLCRPPGTYSIQPIQKLLNCQQCDGVLWVLLQAFILMGSNQKTALWLWVREITWYLYTRGVRGWMNAKQRWFKVTVSWMVSSLFSASCSWRPLDCRIRHSHLASTLFHSLTLWWRPWRTWPQITCLSQLETSAMNRMIWIPFGCSINLCQFFWIYSIPFKHQRTCYLQQPFKEYWICMCSNRNYDLQYLILTHCWRVFFLYHPYRSICLSVHLPVKFGITSYQWFKSGRNWWKIQNFANICV